MKKFNTMLAVAIMFIMSVVSANAQMINKVNLESFAKQQYGSNWEKAADKQLAHFDLDHMGNLVLTKEIQAPNLSQNELYMEMANWFVCNYGNSIQFADKESGTLIARPFIENIARYAGGWDAYNISICPTVRVKVMDGKLNLSYTLRDYNVMVEKGEGNTAKAVAVGAAAAVVTAGVIAATNEPSHHAPAHKTTVVDHYGYGHHTTTIYREYHPHHHLEDALLLSCIANSASYTPAPNSKTWELGDCYPFVKKDSHKKASSKAFVMANIYSQVVIENIEAAINECSYAYAH